MIAQQKYSAASADILIYSKGLRTKGNSLSAIRQLLHNKGYSAQKIALAISTIQSDEASLLYFYESDWVHTKKALGNCFLLILGIASAYGCYYFSVGFYDTVMAGRQLSVFSRVFAAALFCFMSTFGLIPYSILELKELQEEYLKVKQVKYLIRCKD